MAGITVRASDFIAKRKAIRKNQRYIGVEIEMGLKSGTTKRGIEQLIETPIGLEGRIKKQEIMRYAGVDGTGIEYSILPIQLELWLESNPTLDKIKNRFDQISKKLKPEPGNGIHIHYSLRPEDPKDLPMRALWLNKHAQNILEKIAGRSTHWAGEPMFSEEHYDEFKKRSNIWENSKSVQFTYKPDIKTLEWRGPRSTYDFQRIQACVKFYDRLMIYLKSPEWENIPIGQMANNIMGGFLAKEQRELNRRERATIITKEGAIS